MYNGKNSEELKALLVNAFEKGNEQTVQLDEMMTQLKNDLRGILYKDVKRAKIRKNA
ncbi:hypothetical protein HNQ94_003012 [Salirhabdus euzebyi]|uniref:Uncharacterized protein n=1 Tax=Salirhabdus euzebyi TaxID=394506 RepID=A0A841Q868_9BACI|nr:hypothetical protein [Salirhabdus euzebyi]MBB6454523.1 hypothetical protein [Salirhabdus euzebyi]